MRTEQDWEERTNKQTKWKKHKVSSQRSELLKPSHSERFITYACSNATQTKNTHTTSACKIPRATETQTLNHLSSQDGELKLTSDGPRVELLIYWAIPPQVHPRPTGFGFTNLVQTSDGLSLLLQNTNSANSSRHSIPLATVLTEVQDSSYWERGGTQCVGPHNPSGLSLITSNPGNKSPGDWKRETGRTDVGAAIYLWSTRLAHG